MTEGGIHGNQRIYSDELRQRAARMVLEWPEKADDKTAA